MSDKYSTDKHEWGTDAGTKLAKDMTPGENKKMKRFKEFAKKVAEAKDQYVVMDRKTGKAVTKPMGMQQALDAYEGRGGNAKGLAVVKTTDKRLKEEVDLDEGMKPISAGEFKKIHDKHKAAAAKGGNHANTRSITKSSEHGVLHQYYSHKSHNLPIIWKTPDGKKHWVKEEVDLDEGAVISTTVRKEIMKNGGKNVGQNNKEIYFTLKGKKHSVPLYKNFVSDKDYMKLQDTLNEEVNLDENTLLKVNKLSSTEYQRAKKLKGFDKDNYVWNKDQQLYHKKMKEEVEQVDEGRVDDMRQKVKDKIKPEFHNKYDFKKIKDAQTMLNFLNRAKMYKHLKEEVEQVGEAVYRKGDTVAFYTGEVKNNRSVESKGKVVSSNKKETQIKVGGKTHTVDNEKIRGAIEESLREKSTSQAQQKFFGMVRAKQKGEMDNASPAVAKAAKSMSKKDVKDFAATKHKGLPKKKDED